MQRDYVVACLLCGRQLGQVVRGRLRARTGRPMLRRAGRALRCGHCGGSVVFEPDETRDPPDWVAEMAREQAVARGA